MTSLPHASVSSYLAVSDGFDDASRHGHAEQSLSGLTTRGHCHVYIVWKQKAFTSLYG